MFKCFTSCFVLHLYSYIVQLVKDAMKEMIPYWSELISAISSAIEQLSENLSQFNAGSINLLKHLLWESELRLSQAILPCVEALFMPAINQYLRLLQVTRVTLTLTVLLMTAKMKNIIECVY